MRDDVEITRQSESGPPTEAKVDGKSVELRNYGSSHASYGQTEDGEEVKVEY